MFVGSELVYYITMSQSDNQQFRITPMHTTIETI